MSIGSGRVPHLALGVGCHFTLDRGPVAHPSHGPDSLHLPFAQQLSLPICFFPTCPLQDCSLFPCPLGCPPSLPPVSTLPGPNFHQDHDDSCPGDPSLQMVPMPQICPISCLLASPTPSSILKVRAGDTGGCRDRNRSPQPCM